MDKIAIALGRARRALGLSIEHELSRHDVDLEAGMALVLHGLGDARMTMTEIGQHHFYAGTNWSYTRQQLENDGYIRALPAPDKRRRLLELTDRGQRVRKLLDELFAMQAQQASRMLGSPLSAHLTALQQLEHFITGLVV